MLQLYCFINNVIVQNYDLQVTSVQEKHKHDYYFSVISTTQSNATQRPCILRCTEHWG